MSPIIFGTSYESGFLRFSVSNAKYLTFNTSNVNAVSHLSARGFTPTRLQQRSKLPRGDNWNHMSVYVVDPTSNGG